MNLFTDIYESPVGPLQMISDDRNLCLLKYFRDNKTEEYISSKISGFNIINKSNQVIRDTSKQLNEYFSRKRKIFDISLSFLYGTAFQKKVWKNLSSIKYGETVSYMDVANLIDNPKSYRAVGNANSKNPISIIIPCHRVIASDGTLGGYGGGLNSKKILLEIEL